MLRALIFGAFMVAGGGAALAVGQPEAPGPATPAPVAPCPYNALRLAVGAELRCTCPPSATMSGSVWGSGPYTADSVVCRAAVHAGAIRREGGEVRLRVSAGRERYRGSERRGVITGTWGAYASSMEFDR